MNRGEEFKRIYAAREAAAEAQSALAQLIKEAKATGADRGPLVDTFIHVNSAQMNLSKIIDAVHAKRYTW